MILQYGILLSVILDPSNETLAMNLSLEQSNSFPNLKRMEVKKINISDDCRQGEIVQFYKQTQWRFFWNKNCVYQLIQFMIFIVILALSLFLVDQDFNNDCVLSVLQWQSPTYMTHHQHLLPIPKTIPSILPIPHALKIPALLFQTNQHNSVPIHMYQTILNNIDLNPQFEYHFYDSEDRRNFMKSMGERYLRIYDVLLPAAYKADVWRYTVVYKYGGCYMDAGSITVRPLVELLRPEDEFVSSQDSDGKGLNSAFFCATKGNRILGDTLELVFEAVESHAYGEDCLDITGPFKFLKGLKKYLNTTTLQSIPKDYGNGVRLLSRPWRYPCLITPLHDNSKTYVISKYPAYMADMRRYTSKQRYGVMWKNRRVFKDQSENRTKN